MLVDLKLLYLKHFTWNNLTSFDITALQYFIWNHMTSKLLKKQGYGYVYSRKELYSCPLGIVTDVLPDNPDDEVQN